MKDANEETLKRKKPYQMTVRKYNDRRNISLDPKSPASKHMLPNTKNCSGMNAMIKEELLKKISHLQSLFKIVILCLINT